MIKKFLFLLLLVFSTIIMFAQVTTSAISGKVSGTDKISLPGATVIAVHVPTGTQYNVITDNDGLFRIPNMQVGGPYKLTVSYVGYQTKIHDDINLQLGQTLSLSENLTETYITMSEVEVIAKKNELIDGNKTGASTNVNSNTIKTLPTINRSITDYTKLSPQSNGNSFAGRDGDIIILQ